MKPTCPLFLLLAALLGLAQCKKDNPDPASQLPAATQTGANTFGCLVNGQVWKPQGYNGNSNYIVVYDVLNNKEILSVMTYRYASSSSRIEALNLDASPISKAGVYSFRSPQLTRAVFNDGNTNCYWSSNDSATTYRRGSLTITRLDLAAGVISGTFDFTLYRPGCDTVKVTQGRFDKRL